MIGEEGLFHLHHLHLHLHLHLRLHHLIPLLHFLLRNWENLGLSLGIKKQFFPFPFFLFSPFSSSLLRCLQVLYLRYLHPFLLKLFFIICTLFSLLLFVSEIFIWSSSSPLIDLNATSRIVSLVFFFSFLFLSFSFISPYGFIFQSGGLPWVYQELLLTILLLYMNLCVFYGLFSIRFSFFSFIHSLLPKIILKTIFIVLQLLSQQII